VKNNDSLQVTTLGEDDEDGDDDGGASQQLDDLIEELSGEVTNSTEIMDDDEDEDEEDPIEMVHVDEDFYYMAHAMRLMAFVHSLVSLAMLIAYYHLKVNSHSFIKVKN
jgi:ryanodine receptor 2